MKILQGLIIAFSMYSKLPVPTVNWNKDNMKYSMVFFPFIGIVCGALITAWYYLSNMLSLGSVLTSIVYVIIPVLITGGIHMDGFLDTIDAISSYQTMERRLEILKDSNSGAFAIIYGIVYMLLYVGIWSEVEDFKAILVISVGFVFSRALSGFGITKFKCAKNSGLAATFSSMAHRKIAGVILVVESILCGLGMILIDVKYGVVAIISGVIMFFIYRAVAYKKFGGITGDLAGFFLQMCEIIMAAAVMMAGEKI